MFFIFMYMDSAKCIRTESFTSTALINSAKRPFYALIVTFIFAYVEPDWHSVKQDADSRYWQMETASFHVDSSVEYRRRSILRSVIMFKTPLTEGCSSTFLMIKHSYKLLACTNVLSLKIWMNSMFPHEERIVDWKYEDNFSFSPIFYDVWKKTLLLIISHELFWFFHKRYAVFDTQFDNICNATQMYIF